MATHTLRLTDEQLNVINAGLQEVALKHAGPLIAEINRQIAEEKAAELRQEPAADIKPAWGSRPPLADDASEVA